MKEKEFFKKSIDENIMEKDEILMRIIEENRKQENIKIENRKRKPGYLKVATTLAVTTTVLGLTMFSPFKSGENNGSIAGVEDGIKKNKFSIIAYAVDFEADGTIKKIEDSFTLLKADVKKELPIGSIVLGDYREETLEDGTIYKWYENSFTSEGGFLCEGEDIESVTFTSESGGFNYFDVNLLKEKEQSGEVLKVEMNIPRNQFSNIDDTDVVMNEFEKMWNEGLLEEYKNKYFQGEDLISSIYEGKYSWGIRDNVEEDFITFRISGEVGSDVMKGGNSITVKSGEEVSYVPEGALKELSKTGNPNFEELPKDNITVEVKYKSGNKAIAKLEVSFNKYGKMVGEIKE